jgi:hypothetical protein
MSDDLSCQRNFMRVIEGAGWSITVAVRVYEAMTALAIQCPSPVRNLPLRHVDMVYLFHKESSRIDDIVLFARARYSKSPAIKMASFR